jgi:outer membrane protein TolC
MDAATSAVGAARAPWFPQIAFEASATRFEEPMLTAPIHEFNPAAFPDFNRTLYGGSAVFEYKLFDGGSRNAKVRGARAEAAAADAQWEQAQMAIIAQVTNTYLGVLSTAGLLDAHDRRIAALTAERDRVDRFLSEGTAPQVDLLRVDAALASAEADRVAAAAALDVVQHGLALLIGASPDETQASMLIPVVLRDEPQTEDRETLLTQTQAVSPALRRAREQLVAAEAGRKAVVGTWFPSIDLFGGLVGYGYPSGFTSEWQVGARLKYPVFTGGARASAIARSTALTKAAREAVRLSEIESQENLDIAISAVNESHARVAAMVRAVAHNSEVARIEQLALQEGAGTQTDYLRAEAELFTARAALVGARHREIAARVELARVVGELDLKWLERIVEVGT